MLFTLLCIYISLYYIRPFEWIPGLKGTPIFFVLGVVSILALIFAWLSGKIRLFRYKTDVLILGFTGAIFLSHLIRGYVGGAVDSVVGFLPALVGYFLVVHALDSQKKVQAFIVLLIGLTTFLGYEAWIQSIQGFSHGGMEPLIQSQNDFDGVREEIMRVRWFGLFNDPNDLGLAFVLPIPLLIERLQGRKYLLAATCLPILLYGIYLTNSRGAMLALVGGVFSYLVLRYRSYRGVVAGCLVAAIAILFGPSRMAGMSAEEASAFGRIEAWYEGFQMFKSSPLFGVGQGMFTEYYHLTAHNSFMQVLAELGFLGSVFFVGLFALPLIWSWQRLYKIEPETTLIEEDRCFFCALTGSLIGTMTAMFFLSRSYILLPFLGVALMTTYDAIAKKGDNTSVPEVFFAPIKWKLLTSIVILEIIFINFLVKFFI